MKHQLCQFEAGVRYHKAGNLAEAAKSYRQVLSEDPKQPDALHLLGMVAHANGHSDEAVTLISESLRIKPGSVEALNDLAVVVQGRGGLAEAAELYDVALAAAPDQDHLHSNRGEVLRQLGRFEEAHQSFSSALKLNPNSYKAHSNLGTLYNELECYPQAELSFERAVELNPALAQAHCNLGAVLRKQGKFTDADACFWRALTLQPRCAPAYIELGASLRGQGRTTEAIDMYWRALEIDPRSDLALNNLGNALREIGSFSEALACFQKAIEINPNSWLAHNNLGSTLIEGGRSQEAIVSLRRALEIRPNYSPAHNNLGTALLALGRPEEATECFRRALEFRPGYSDAFSNRLFALNYLSNPDREALFAEHLRFDETFGAQFKDHIAPHANEAAPERRIKVGYVSADLRQHPVAYFIQPVLEGYSRENFEVFCYANHTVDDAMTAQLRKHVDHWRSVAAYSDAALAAAIREDEIDILVDLSGHTARNRMLVFARKPAPVQVTMIGYMQTSGLSTMDYRITDEQLDPSGVSNKFSTEKLVRMLSGAATFKPPAHCPEIGELPALANGHVTFASFNTLAKVTPDVISTWARLLHRVPTARLLVVGRAGNSVGEEFDEHGIGADRLEIVDRLPLQEYLALHNRVDFLLDTFPYCGGTTALLALWMGVPFVTLAGETPTGRAGKGLLCGLGLDKELVAETEAEYVAKAVAAVSNLPKLIEWRATLRPRLAPLLGGDAGYVRELEFHFRAMWREWCEHSRGLGSNEAQLS